MNLRRLSNREIKQLNKELNLNFDKKSKISICTMTDQTELILSENEPFMFKYKGKWIPTLKQVLKKGLELPKITVDMGAIKYVVNGADIMRPGIVEIDPYKDNEPVLIVDQQHKKPIAIGIPTIGYYEMKNIKKGKVVKNLHYIGDKIWKFSL